MYRVMEQAVDSASVQAQYIRLIFPIMRELFIQILLLGPFFAGFGILREIAKEGHSPFDSLVIQRLLLIGGMMFFTVGMVIGYTVWRDSEYIVVEKLSEIDTQAFAYLTLIMVPIEITVVLLLAMSFVAISIKTFANYESIKNNLKFELSALSLLISLAFLTYIFWFIPILYVENSLGELFFIQNAGYHAIGAALFFCIFLLWNLVSSSFLYRRSSILWDWVFTILISSTVTASYAVRQFMNFVS